MFVIAVQRVAQLRDPDRLTPWLFAIARHVCFRRLAERRRTSPIDLRTDVVVLDDRDDDDTIAPEAAAALVWAAADGLNERDRTLVYLNTREGLTGADLAAAVGVKHANPYSLLTRAKAQLARSLEVLVVARVGRRDCDELSNILTAWDGDLTPILRKRLARHVDACANCQRTKTHIHAMARARDRAHRKRRLTPTRSLPRTCSRSRTADRSTTERWQRDGFPPPIDDHRKRRALIAALVAAVAVFLAVLAVNTGDGPTTRPITAEATATHVDTATTRVPTARATTTTTAMASATTSSTQPSAAAKEPPAGAPVGVPPTSPRAGVPTPTTAPESGRRRHDGSASAHHGPGHGPGDGTPQATAASAAPAAAARRQHDSDDVPVLTLPHISTREKCEIPARAALLFP